MMMPIMAATDASTEKPAMLVLTDFPGEQPDYDILKAWLDRNKDALITSGFSAVMRGAIPTELTQYTIKKERKAIPEGASDTEKASINDKNDEIAAYNKALAIQLKSKHDELKTRFGARLSACLRAKAPMRLKQMQARLQLKDPDGAVIEDAYDGHLMWKELRALIEVPLLESKLKRHQTELERLRDSRLPDNVSAEEWAARMVEFQKHNEHVDIPYVDKRLSKAMLGMLPKGLDVDRRDLERTIESNDKWDDVLEVNKMITKILDSSHEPDAAPLALAGGATAYVTQAQMAELLRRAPTMAVGGGRRNGSKPGATPKAPGEGRKKWYERTLAPGEKCPNGTCTFKHGSTTQCWMDSQQEVSLWPAVFDDAWQFQMVKDARTAHAASLGKPAKGISRRIEGKGKTTGAPVAAVAPVAAAAAPTDTTPSIIDVDDLCALVFGNAPVKMLSDATDDLQSPLQVTEAGLFESADEDDDGAGVGFAIDFSSVGTPIPGSLKWAASPVVQAEAQPTELGVKAEATPTELGAAPGHGPGWKKASGRRASASPASVMPEDGFSFAGFCVTLCLLIIGTLVCGGAAGWFGHAPLALTCATALSQGGRGLASSLALSTAAEQCAPLQGFAVYWLVGLMILAATHSTNGMAVAVASFLGNVSTCMAKAAVQPITTVRRAGGMARGFVSCSAVLFLVALMLGGVSSAHVRLPSKAMGQMVPLVMRVAHSGLDRLPSSMKDAVRYNFNQKTADAFGLTRIDVLDRRSIHALCNATGFRDVEIADSGACYHVLRTPLAALEKPPPGAKSSAWRLVPGSARANNVSVATANGVVTPHWMVDVHRDCGMSDGTVKSVKLNSCLIMEDCPHDLVSLGRLAKEENVGSYIGPANSSSHLVFPDGKTAPMANLGVLVLPKVDGNWARRAAGLLQLFAGAARPVAPVVTQGARRNLKIDESVLHGRGIHRTAATLNNWHKCSNAPASWQMSDKYACDDCLMSKADGVPSDGRNPVVAKAGDLVSFDVMKLGVKHVHGGQTAVLGIHDHHSQFNWVRLLRNETEDEMIAAWREYLNYAKSHNVTIKRVHTDNFSSHVGAKMRAFFRDEVKARYTTIVPNTPRQNGAMERQWRTMANDTRSCMHRSRMSKNYAWYALQHVVQVANTLPKAGWPSTCAHKIFTGRAPMVTGFRVFGCMMYAQVFNPISKMADRAVRCIHLGRLPNQPGYLGLDPETGKLVQSVNCRFVETECPGLTLARAGWLTAMPSYHALYDADAPLANDESEFVAFEQTILDPGHAPLVDAPAPEAVAPADGANAPAADARPQVAPVPASVARPRRAQHGPGFYQMMVTALATLSSCLQPGGRAFGTQFLGLSNEANGSYVIYLCSGAAHEQDLQHVMRKLSAAQTYVINVDTEQGGHAHDLSTEQVTDRLVTLAQDPRCLGVLATVPCSPWSAARMNGNWTKVLFDSRHPDGIPNDQGQMPLQTIKAKRIVANAIKVAEAALGHDGHVVFESPVARGEGSQFAIKGRELHSSIWDLPMMQEFASKHNMQPVAFDQCRLGAGTQKTTQLLCSERMHRSVFKRVGHLMCNHDRDAHASILRDSEATSDQAQASAKAESHSNETFRAGDKWAARLAGKEEFRTKATERFPLALNQALAESFLEVALEGGWLKRLGTAIEPFTNSNVDAVSLLAEVARADAVNSEQLRKRVHFSEDDGGTLSDAVQLLASMDRMINELVEDQEMETLRASSADLALMVRALTAPAAPAMAVSNAQRNSSDFPTYKQAMSGQEAKEWSAAMDAEIDNFERFGTFDMNIPEDSLPSWSASSGRAAEVVDMMWVLKKKYNEVRELLKRKARGTIRGDQGKAIDTKLNVTPGETFAPTVKHQTCKMVLAAACIRARENHVKKLGRAKMRMRTADADAAFLQGHQQSGRTRYVRPPQGYRHFDRRDIPIVWKLVGNCYGDETAPRVWFESLLPVLLKIGFTQSDADPCFLFKIYPDGSRFDLVLYVDDILACDDAGALADADFAAVQRVFKFTIREEAVHFLNMNVSVINEWTVKISMEAYLLRMADTYVPDWRSWPKLASPAADTLQDDYDEAHEAKTSGATVASDELITRYRGKVGALIYAAPTVRADVSYVASRLSRAQTFATPKLEGQLDRSIVYLAQTADTGLTFDASQPQADELWAASDSDWAVGHSTTGFVIFWCSVAILHVSKRQPCIATSSTEAEIIAASTCAQSLVFALRISRELGFMSDVPARLLVDNSGAVELSRDRKSCHRSRHVDRRYFKVRELVAEGWIHVEHVPTADNSADVLTKVLGVDSFRKHVGTVMNLPI